MIRNTYIEQDDFNPFTEVVLNCCAFNGSCNVLCRDGVVRTIRYSDVDYEEGHTAEDSNRYFHCRGKNEQGNYFFIWNNDGSSVNSRIYDMVALED